MRRAGVLLFVVALPLAGLALGGCLEVTASSQFHRDGTAKVDVELALDEAVMTAMSAFMKDDSRLDPSKECEGVPLGGSLPAGFREGKWSTRGDRNVCIRSYTAQLDDPVKAAKEWASRTTPSNEPIELKEFRLERRDASSYRLAALIAAKASSSRGMGVSDPAFANRYITLSVSAVRIENTTGEIDKDGSRVTWKMPLATLLNPPPGFKQEIRADIVYAEAGWLDTIGGWFDGLKRLVGR